MSTATPRVSRLPVATPVSRVLRTLLGIGMLAMVIPPALATAPRQQVEVLAVFAGLVLTYTAVHALVSRYFGRVHPWLGAVIAVTPAVAVFLAGGVFEAGVVLFIGASLVLIAATGQPGCEVLAFPAILLGRRTHLACLLFSPIDSIEGKMRKNHAD